MHKEKRRWSNEEREGKMMGCRKRREVMGCSMKRGGGGM